MKFYLFSQNNSGGSFVIDDNLDLYVIIEALDAEHANRIAEAKGIYFDGVDDDRDCECCGDRWTEVSEDEGTDEPMIYRQTIDEYYEQRSRNTLRSVVIHYNDGRKRHISKFNQGDQ